MLLIKMHKIKSGAGMERMPDKSDKKYDAPPSRLAQGSSPEAAVRVVVSLDKAKIATKPWGREIMLSESPDYTFKKIEIKAGCQTSLQCHNKKSETIMFLTGKPRVVFEDNNGKLVYLDMLPGSIFEVRPPAVHRVVALTDITYVEASTPDPQGLDVIRLRDSFQRKDGRLENEYK
jgi:mannose-6-phosphate isomerase-like protein (cupin superfamily)